MQLTSQYYYDVSQCVDKLWEFADALKANQAFCSYLNIKVPTRVKIGDDCIEKAEDKIIPYLYADIIRCYNWLGLGKGIINAESLALILASLKFTDNSRAYSLFSFSFSLSVLAPYVEQLVDAVSKSIKDNSDILILEYCLRTFNEDLHSQYIVLLYRFASLAAKADGTVTPKEQEWLNRIFGLKELSDENGDGIEMAVDPVVQLYTPEEKEPRANEELNALIGLSSVKEEINTLTNFIRIQKLREKQGLRIPPLSYHCVFTGNPGTGKTTVARIVSKIYKELGVLKKGHLVETDRSGLVAEYLGQTAAKTNKIIDSALDGVLFVDEAYSLTDGGQQDSYGKEAIATLLKRMEDDRERLVVILAGYTDDMKQFIDSNPGLQSRFNRYIEFKDYTPDELFQIFEFNASKYQYCITDDAKLKLREALEQKVKTKDKNFGNGRYVRNLFEKVIECQANRLSYDGQVSSQSLSSLSAEDITSALERITE